MTNAWDVAKGLAEKHAQAGGLFVRLANNGDKVTGVFCGEPFAREVVAEFEKRSGIHVQLVPDTEAGKTTGLVRRIASHPRR